MKIAPMTYDERSWPPNRPKPPKFDPAILHAQISQFARQPNFAISYREELARSNNVRVLMNAHAVGLVPATESARLDRVEIKALSGKTAAIRAKFVVVCCGAINTRSSVWKT